MFIVLKIINLKLFRPLNVANLLFKFWDKITVYNSTYLAKILNLQNPRLRQQLNCKHSHIDLKLSKPVHMF